MKKHISWFLAISILLSLFNFTATAKENEFLFAGKDLSNGVDYTDNETENDINNNLEIDLSTLSGAGANYTPHGYPGKTLISFGYGTVVSLGIIDLSLFDACEVTYATDLGYEAFRDGMTATAMWALKNNAETIGYVNVGPNENGLLGKADCVDASITNPGGTNWDKGERTAVIDLSAQNYNGEVFLSHFNSTGQEVLLVSLKFIAPKEVSNLALGRPVDVTIDTGNGNLGSGFWDKDYLTDGQVPVFQGEGDQSRLGWYAQTTVEAIDCKLTIDLGGLCAISKVVLSPQTFLQGAQFPTDYEIQVSTDGSTWTKVAGETGHTVSSVDNVVLTFDETDARYVRMAITKAGVNPGDGTYHTGFAEFEIYGYKKEGIIEYTASTGLAYSFNDDYTCVVTGIGSCTDTEVIIPNVIEEHRVTGISEKAFENQTQITSLFIPYTVSTIGRRAFYGCTGLTELTIPESVTNIGAQIIYKADNIHTVYYNSPYFPSTETENPFLNNAGIKKVVFGGYSVGSYAARNLGIQNKIEEVEILDTVDYVGAYAFYNCPNLQSVSIDARALNDYTFASCLNLEEVTFGDHFQRWGYFDFENCTNLINVTLSNSITYIGYSSFYGCSSLPGIVIPSNVTSIGYGAFSGCSSLSIVELPASITIIGGTAFSGCNNLADVYYTGTADDWCRITFDYSSSNPCFNGAALYVNGELLTNVELTDEVAGIGQYAFYNCKSIASVSIPDSVAVIGQYAFYGCSNLLNITIPDSVTSICSYAFGNCTNLVNAIIPDSISVINDYVFSYCISLSKIEIPDSVTSIGAGAFSGCSNMYAVMIPDSIIIIGNDAFYNCSKLSTVYYGGSSEQWNDISIGYNNEALSRSTVYYSDAAEIAVLSALYINSNSYTGSTGRKSANSIFLNRGDKLYVLGWFAGKDKTVDRVIWTLDGVENECSDNYEDRYDLAETVYFTGAGWSDDDFTRAGFGHASLTQGGMMELQGLDTTPSGEHTVSIIGLFTDGSSVVLKDSFTLYYDYESGYFDNNPSGFMYKCFDGAFLTNNGEANTHIPGSDERDVKNDVIEGDLGSIYGLDYGFLHLQGFVTDDDEFTDLGYQINNGEIIWGLGVYDANIIGLTGAAYALRFNYNLPIIEGNITVDFYEQLASGKIRKYHTITYTNAVPDPNVKQFAKIKIGERNSIGVWLKDSINTATLKFTTAGEFKGFGEPIYWASNESSGAGAYAKIRIDLFEYAYNTEYTLQQSPVKSFNLFPLGDNNPVAFFNFDEPLPAGTYIVRYTLTNPEDYISVGGEEKYPYFVLPKMDSNPDENKFEYSSEDQVFNFTVLGEVISGEFFVDNPTEVSAPITAGHLYVSSAEGHAGDEVTLDVMITENPGIIALGLDIAYDTNVLELVSATAKDFNGVSFGPLTNQPFKLSWDDVLNPDNTQSGVIAQLKFVIKEGAPLGDTTVTLSYDADNIFNANYENVPFSVAGGTVTVNEEEPPFVEPDITILACNLSFQDSIYIKYAVSTEDISAVKMLFWTSPQTAYVYGTHNTELDPGAPEKVGSTMCAVFQYRNVFAKQMTDTVYARAYIEIGGVKYYSEVKKYSVLQYAYNKTGRTGTASTNQKLINLLNDMLQYGSSAQKYFNYKTGRLATMDFYQVQVVGGWLSDMCDSGLYLPGESVTLTAPATNAEGLSFLSWQDSNENIVSTEATFTVTVGNTNEVYTAVYGSEIDYSLFEFESNGDGTCVIVGLNQHESTEIELPEYAPNGDLVTEIDAAAFAGEDITSITIPASITSIGRNAFKNCDALTEVHFLGTRAQWEAIAVASGNDVLSTATVYCANDMLGRFGSCILEADFSGETLDESEFVAWNGYALQDGSLHLGHGGDWVSSSPIVRTADTFTNYIANFKMFGDKRDCYYGFGLRCNDQHTLMVGGRFGVPSASERSVGIAIDIFGGGNSTLGDNIGITFCDGGENGNAPAFMIPRPNRYDPGVNAEFLVVDSTDEISIYIDNYLLVTIKLYGLTDGVYTSAVVYDANGTELFDDNVTVLEAGTIVFYQRNNHIVISDFSVYELLA